MTFRLRFIIKILRPSKSLDVLKLKLCCISYPTLKINCSSMQCPNVVNNNMKIVAQDSTFKDLYLPHHNYDCIEQEVKNAEGIYFPYCFLEFPVSVLYFLVLLNIHSTLKILLQIISNHCGKSLNNLSVLLQTQI